MLLGLTDLVLRRPWLFVVGTLISALLLGSGMRLLRADTDVTRDLPQRLPAKALYDRIDELFPSKELVIVGIEGADLFGAPGLARLDRLTRRIEKLEGVHSVLGPTNAPIIAAVDGGLDVRAAADPLPSTAKEAEAVRARLYGQPLFVGSLLSEDGGAVAILVFIKGAAREADVAEQLILFAADPDASEGLTLHVTGRAAATYWAKVLMGRDMGMLSSAALLVVILLLAASFRSFRGVLLPVGVVVTSVAWTLGLMGYADIPLSHSTEVLPILLVAIGVADGIHILKGYYERARGGGERAAVVRETMADLNRPVILTSITTIVGFLALASSGIESIAMLGFLTSFGVLAALVFSLTFIPAVLSLLPVPRARPVEGAPRGRFLRLESGARRYADLLVARRWLVGGLVLGIMAAAGLGALGVKAEFSNLSNFRADHPFRTATEAVNRHFAATTSLSVVVEGEGPDAIKDPEVLAKMDALETWLREQPHVGSVQSLVGYVKQMHRVMHGDGPEAYRLPGVTEQEQGTELVEVDGVEVEREVAFEVSGRELVAQYLTLYELSGKPGDFANLVTYDYSTARMSVFLDSDRASDLTEVHDGIRAFIDQNFEGQGAELTGMAELMRAVNAMVVSGQGWSILTSLLLVLLVSAVMFRSPVLGLFATLPLFFSLFLNFGVMGLTGISLNVMTMATSSVAVGVGIDYAIHFIHRYQSDRRAGLDAGAAVRASMEGAGIAIALNAVTVALGFAALGLSEFSGVRHMGLLIALTMLTSAFAALTVLPLLFLVLRPKVLEGAAPSSEAARAAA